MVLVVGAGAPHLARQSHGTAVAVHAIDHDCGGADQRRRPGAQLRGHGIAPGASRVSITLRDSEDGTVVDLEHEFETPAQRDMHDPGWRFQFIGRRLERMQWMCGTLKHTVGGPPEMELTWLLRLADSIITYRARYMARPEWLPVLDLLIRDEANPRSIAFQVQGLREYAQRLADLYGDFGDERFHGALASLLQLDPAAELQPGNERLLARLDDWQAAAYRHGEQLSLRFFSHVGEASSQTFAT